MEKISFPLLIEYLSQHADEYNLRYDDEEMRSGSIDRRLFSRWIVRVIEPLVISAAEVSPDRLPEVFNVFYSSLLSLLGKKMALTYQHEYQQAWSVCRLIPELVAQHPQRILNAINSALISLRLYQPENVLRWIKLMLKLAPFCKSVEAFLNSGRFAAWLCGMAHLRTRAIEIYPRLSNEIQAILRNEDLPVPLTDLLECPWGRSGAYAFQGVAGGFAGYGDAFSRPPLVLDLQGTVMASDGLTSYALFADALGTVLIRDVSADPGTVREQAAVTANIGLDRDLNSSVQFDDITSCVNLDSSSIITRSSSHYLFIFSNDSRRP